MQMINGLGVLGWGVGGIEAEAVMLGNILHSTSDSVFLKPKFDCNMYIYILKF